MASADELAHSDAPRSLQANRGPWWWRAAGVACGVAGAAARAAASVVGAACGQLYAVLVYAVCPCCKRRTGAPQHRVVIGCTRHDYVTLREVRHFDLYGRYVGSTYERIPVTGVRQTYEQHYRCSHCHHKWHKEQAQVIPPPAQPALTRPARCAVCGERRFGWLYQRTDGGRDHRYVGNRVICVNGHAQPDWFRLPG
jgi:hypothetical protein